MLLGSGAQKKKRKTKKLKFNCVSIPCKKGRPQTKELKLNFVKSTRKRIISLRRILYRTLSSKLTRKAQYIFFNAPNPNHTVLFSVADLDPTSILYMYSIVSQENFAFSVLLKMFGVIQIQHRNLCLSIKSVSPPKKIILAPQQF